MSATVAHPQKTARATATSLRADAPQRYAALQPNNCVATAGNSAQQPRLVAPIAASRNKRNSPLKRRKSRCASLARAASRSERSDRGTGSLRLRCAPPGRSAAFEPTQFAADLPNTTAKRDRPDRQAQRPSSRLKCAENRDTAVSTTGHESVFGALDRGQTIVGRRSNSAPNL
jgi:hypothetical protein